MVFVGRIDGELTQIEGAVTEDGRGPSIWIRSAISCDLGGDNGASLATATIVGRKRGADERARHRCLPPVHRLAAHLPEGRGRRTKDWSSRPPHRRILAADIEPWICLYHWDLPQALEDRGGWQHRDVASWFADYAHLTVRHLGDRVKHWATFNEPNAAALKGYCDGEHAPGIRGRMTALKAIHVMNLAHGLGFDAMRSERSDLLIGNIYNFHPREPASEREQDEAAALMLDALWNHSFPDPQIHGHYPEPLAAEMEEFIEPGDLDIVRRKPDYFAINHYTRTRVRHDRPSLSSRRATTREPVTEMAEIAPMVRRWSSQGTYGGDFDLHVERAAFRIGLK
jgi:beta-glucosidase